MSADAQKNLTNAVHRIRASALRDAADQLDTDPTATRGTMKRIYHQVYATWLRELADEMEGKTPDGKR